MDAREFVAGGRFESASVEVAQLPQNLWYNPMNRTIYQWFGGDFIPDFYDNAVSIHDAFMFDAVIPYKKSTG